MLIAIIIQPTVSGDSTKLTGNVFFVTDLSVCVFYPFYMYTNDTMYVYTSE